MKKNRTLYECDKKEIEELLLGHKVVAYKADNLLILDNGVLTFRGEAISNGKIDREYDIKFMIFRKK